jgi:hypothetical protein
MSSLFNYVPAPGVPMQIIQERNPYLSREGDHHTRRPRHGMDSRIGRGNHRRGNSDPNLNSPSRDLDQSGYERDPRSRKFDSQDVAAVVQDVAAAVKDELHSQLNSFLQDIKAEIQPALEANQLTSQPTVSPLV